MSFSLLFVGLCCILSDTNVQKAYMKETVSMGKQRKLTVLLIEDDKFACEEIRNYIDQLDDVSLLGVTDLMNCHGFAYMNCHQIDWFSVISQPHRAAA